MIERLLNNPLVYRFLASQVDRKKIAAIRKIRRDFSGLKVLDIGCGTGNNAHLFIGSDYTGIDINRDYIALARKRFPALNFLVSDAEKVRWEEHFDVILLNSFLHHLADEPALVILKEAAAALQDEGIVIVQEPLIPLNGEWYHRLLRKLDRGDYFRGLEGWKRLLREAGLRPEVKGRYELRVLGVNGYHMVSISASRPMGPFHSSGNYSGI